MQVTSSASLDMAWVDKTLMEAKYGNLILHVEVDLSFSFRSIGPTTTWMDDPFIKTFSFFHIFVFCVVKLGRAFLGMVSGDLN
jgi:hypothetical protein